MPKNKSVEVYTDQLRQDELAIFLFHGVLRENRYAVRNYTRKHIDQQDFATSSAFAPGGTPLSPGDVVEHHKTGTPFPPYAFAITFDDGFENNASVAAPILDDLNIPATFCHYRSSLRTGCLD